MHLNKSNIKYTFLYLVLGTAMNLFSYSQPSYVDPHKNTYKAIVFSDKYDKQYLALTAYLSTLSGAQIVNQKYNGTRAILEIETDSINYIQIANKLPLFGNIQYTDFNKAKSRNIIENYNSKINSSKASIAELENKLKSNDTASWYNRPRELMSRITQQKTELESAKLEMRKALSELNKYYVTIEFNNAYLSSTDFNENDLNKVRKWVNMPGAEFSYLNVEIPKVGKSANAYQGVQIKYIFTRGKDYLQLGAWKSTETVSDSSTIQELFMISAGQDFYSKRWGKGSRKFFNLYSGYNGGILLMNTADDNLKVLPQISPCIGMDLFKTKHVLLDARVSYFLPLSLDYYQNLRGFTYSASFNFVF